LLSGIGRTCHWEMVEPDGHVTAFGQHKIKAEHRCDEAARDLVDDVVVLVCDFRPATAVVTAFVDAHRNRFGSSRSAECAASTTAITTSTE
jgi:NAD(P)-dependent dehydrogenase (short-subunit alcohol dehydrogenase family)